MKDFDAVKDGTKIHVKFRFLKRNENVRELMNLINGIVREPVHWLSTNKFVSFEQERKWLKNILEEQKGRNRHIVVEADGKIAGGGDIRFGSGGCSHVAHFGIALKKDVRGCSIGTKLLEFMMALAKKSGAEVFYIEVFKGNDKALHVYKDKLGFKRCGGVPMCRKRKVNGKIVYDDEILLWRKA